MSRPFAVAAACALCLIAAPAAARITKLEILSSEPAFGGASFGAVGAYDRLLGRVEGVLDPSDPANAIIQDIALAPREAGLVRYSTTIEILKPHDLAKGNRILFFEVNNRGNKLAIGAFNDGVTGKTADRNGLTSPGDGWLMRQGYTMIWFGWEMDVVPGMSHLGMPPIVAHNRDGSPIAGIVRSEIIAPARGGEPAGQPEPTDAKLSPRQLRQLSRRQPRQSAPAAGGFLPTLTVRAREQDPREPIANSEWSFGVCEPASRPRPTTSTSATPPDFSPAGSTS